MHVCDLCCLSKTAHLLVHFLFNLGNLVPKQSRVWQMCGATCYHAHNLRAVQMDFVISWKHMDLNEDF